MACPGCCFWREVLEERGVLIVVCGGGAVLLKLVLWGDRAAFVEGHELEAVADAEDWEVEVEVEYAGVYCGGVEVVDGVWAAREDDAEGVDFLDVADRD